MESVASRPRRRLVLCASLLGLALPAGPSLPSGVAAASSGRPHAPRGEAALSQDGDLFARFSGGIAPAALPRRALAPIAVSIDATVATTSAQDPPAVRDISIAINRHGHLDVRGLPLCRRGQLVASSSAQALAACGRALVGSGRFVAGTTFPEQASYPSHGRILAFNARLDGHEAILAHVYGIDPVPITRVVAFHVHHTGGAYGILLTASLPARANPYGYLKSIELNLYRRFLFRGRLHSYLSAACAAPAGFRGGLFPFAHTSMSFADGRVLASTIRRSCRVRAARR